MSEIILIAAVANNSVIGMNNAIPWHCPEDLAYFSKTTVDNPVIMGRSTYQSIGKPLRKRYNIVMTNQDNSIKNCAVANSAHAALCYANNYNKLKNNNKIYVIGGAKIYEQFIHKASTILITHIDLDVPDGDTFFPELSVEDWKLKTTPEYSLSCNNKLPYRFLRYDRNVNINEEQLSEKIITKN